MNRRFLAEGHLIGSGLFTRMLNLIVDAGADYQVVSFTMGKVRSDSTMLHSIATGNMIPAWARTICVDINPAVVTKLSDRGSGQTIGIVTDVGLFLRSLADKLQR